MIQELKVVEIKSGRVVHRVDVSDTSERSIEKVEDGLLINLDHDRFYVARGWEA
jgi:hypothetical protein